MTGEKARVFITVDTETSIGGDWNDPATAAPVPLERTVYGVQGSHSYGIPLMMDILEQYGLRATFFTEVFCAHCIGPEDVAKLLRYIRQRGHDAQLHLHPVYRFYGAFLKGGPARQTDIMARFSPAEQQELIHEGVALFRELSGVHPIAYRAGCYGASETTLAALRENHVPIDASYNLAYQGTTCQFRTPQLNAPALLEGVYEFPVTVFQLPGIAGYKALEISAVSVGEILGAIRARRQAGILDTVLVLHSFSLLKSRNHFAWYRPDRIVTQRLRKLCAALRELRDEIEVGVLGEVDLRSVPLDQPQLVPTLGLLQASVRKAVQGLNRIPWI